MKEHIKTLDWKILRWIYKNCKCVFLDKAMPKITMLGSGGIFWVITAVIMMCFVEFRLYAVMILVGMSLGAFVGNLVVKNTVCRSRPCWEEGVFDLLIKNPKDYSFPSCHTLSSVIAATILVVADPRFAFVAVPVAMLIAFSRLYLCVHFPSDVLSGMILGIVIGLFTYFVVGSLIVRFWGNSNFLADAEFALIRNQLWGVM